MSKRRVLFVDDQPNVLDGLRRTMRKMHDEWDMEFVSSGAAALAAIEQCPFDVIVVDMIMPGMNGVQLLKKVSERYPETVRFILSGYSDRELILQSAGYAHQYMAKPCDPETLKQLLNHSFGLRELLSREELHARIASIGSLPSPPRIYHQLVAYLQSDTASMKEIADLISQDVGITAKLLQMVNSAFFGLPTHVNSPLQAVNLLGLDTVQGLVLAAGAFNQFKDPGLSGISINTIYDHSMAVGTNAQRIARFLGLSKHLVGDALMAGMLHDIGKLVMLTHFRRELGESIRLAAQESLPMNQAETRILGVSHAEIGAHLLSLWGLPDSILEAVALHHAPQKAASPMVNVLTAVHIANVWDHEDNEGGAGVQMSTVDGDYLTRLNLADQLPRLRELCAAESNRKRSYV